MRKMSENLCDKIENDEFYKTFLQNGKSDLSQKLTIADQIKKLSEGLEILSVELQSQVKEQHGALLSQASHASKLDAGLNAIDTHMTRIQNQANSLRSFVGKQYSLIESQTKILRRLHNASHLLRSCGILVQLAGRLRKTDDFNKQAYIIMELNSLMEMPELRTLELVQEELNFITSTKQTLNSFAHEELLKGLKNQNEDQITRSLNIFSSLQNIDECLKNLIETYFNEIKFSLSECLNGTDITTLASKKQSGNERKLKANQSTSELRGPGKTPTLTTSQHFRTRVCKSMQWLIQEELFDYCKQILILQKCVNNINNIYTLQNKKPIGDVKENFWSLVKDELRKVFGSSPSHIQQCLQENLPKLISAAKCLQNKLNSKFIFEDNLFEPLEAGYLTNCAMNIKATQSGIDQPTQDSIDNLIRVSSSELNAAIVDETLTNLVAAVFISCSKDFWTKIETQLKFGTDSKQVVDVPNPSQIQNINLANLIYYHSEGVNRMIKSFAESFSRTTSARNIFDSLEQGKKLTSAILQQLIESIKTTAGIILMSMHREPGLNEGKLSTSGPSLYLKELQEYLQRCWSYHIEPFHDKSMTLKCGEELATKCVEIFVNNLSIVRPLSTSGRERLKNDCLHMENALKLIISDFSHLGKSYRLLRAISTLITLSPSELVNQEITSESPVPYYTILLLLFGHAGNELQSPHVAAGWSHERFLQWLENHTSDNERLEIIAGALQRYREIIRRKNQTQYDPVYPLLSSFFEKIYKFLH